MTVAEATARSRPPWWRDLRVLRVVVQVVAIAAVGAVAYVLWFNLTNNLRAAGLPTDFDFLTQPLGVDIAGSDLSSGAPIWRGLLVGIKNTLALVVVGIPALTLIGVDRRRRSPLHQLAGGQGRRGIRRSPSEHPPSSHHLLRVQRRDPAISGPSGVDQHV